MFHKLVHYKNLISNHLTLLTSIHNIGAATIIAIYIAIAGHNAICYSLINFKYIAIHQKAIVPAIFFEFMIYFAG